MNKFWSIVCFLLILGDSSAQQKEMDAASINTFLLKFKEVTSRTSSISCDFLLFKSSELTVKPVETKGKFYYSSPDKVRWEEHSGQHYVLVVKSGQITTSNTGKYQNTRHLQGIKDLMVGAANGQLMESNNFKRSFFTEGKIYLVKLLVENSRMKKYFSTVDLYFDSEFRLLSIQLNEPVGDYTKINFINPVFNKSLDANLFNIAGSN